MKDQICFDDSCMDLDNYVLNRINDLLIDRLKYLRAELYIQINKTTIYNTLCAKSDKTLYRDNAKANIAYIYYSTKNESPYICFNSNCMIKFKQNSIPFIYDYYRNNNSQIRCSINVLECVNIKECLEYIIKNSFSFESFGCCSNYIECSAKGECTHDDPLYATACMYRSNLENGKVFY